MFIDGVSNPQKGVVAAEYKNKINQSKNGYSVSWDELCFIGNGFHQIFEILILGSQSQECLHRYEKDQEMYQSCDIVIELIDCAFWQVFSKDRSLLEKIQRKFKKTEVLRVNF